MNEAVRKAFEEWKEKTIRDSYHGGMSAGTSHILSNFRASEGALLAFEAQQKRIDKLKTSEEKFFNLFMLAMDYIQLSPCDPDINSDQAEAWIKLQKAMDEANHE